MVGTDTVIEQILCPQPVPEDCEGRVTATQAHSEAGRKTEMETGQRESNEQMKKKVMIEN